MELKHGHNTNFNRPQTCVFGVFISTRRDREHDYLGLL